ncbi:MAG: right-handed parallel beta-helix repeat-containing protein, partial [Myxococcota bacterium]
GVAPAGPTTIRRNTISQFVPAGDSLSVSNAKWRAGILIENSSPTVEDNAIFDTISGVEVLTSGGGSASPIIRRNTFDRIAANINGWSNVNNPDNVHGAVVLRDGAGGTVQANRISNLWSFNNGRGVFVRHAGAAAIEISDNEILRTYIGIHVHNAAVPVGESIVARRNSIGKSSLTGIYLTRSDATVEDNVVRGTPNSPAQAAGVYLFETTALVQRNFVRDAQYGVSATGGHPEILSNHLAANSKAGILVEATEAGTLIRGNRIEEHVAVFTSTGIIVRHSGASTAGTLVTIDGGNIITGNRVGIRIEGVANSAVGQPVPIITGNSIYDNADTTTLQNIQIVSYSTPPPTQTTLDLSDNWWNTTNQSEIEARILFVLPPGSGLQPIADIDFANVVTAPNTNFFVGALAATVGDVSTRKVYFEPNPGTPSPPVASIDFNVYDPGASVVVRICPELATLCNAATTLFSSAPQTFPAGAASVTWNGTDASGEAVAPEAYVYQLEATKGSVIQVIDSPIRDAYALGALLTPPGAPTSYDGYRNEPFKLKYGNLASGTDSGPMRVVFDVQPRNAAGKLVASERFVIGPENFPDGQPIPAAPGSTKIPYVVWPARSSVTGEIISGATLIEVRPAPLRYYVIIVAGSAPSVTRDTGELNLIAEPRLVYDTFEQVAAIRYKVDRPADVVISLLPPASWDDTGAPTWQIPNVPANTNQLFEFRGHEVLGMDGVTADSARQLVTALAHEGAFTFRVRATDTVSSRTAETLVTVQVRH